MNRRSFFQGMLATVAGVMALSSLAKAEEKRRGSRDAKAAAGAAVLVDPSDAAAKGVNYVHDNKDIKDAKLKTERTGVKFADQRCKNCVFYQKDKETSVGGKKAGPCSMPFATGKVVAAEGWCSSWAKKS